MSKSKPANSFNSILEYLELLSLEVQFKCSQGMMTVQTHCVLIT